MNTQQKILLDKLEIALAGFILDGRKELVKIWVPIIEALHREEFVWAVILAAVADVPKPLVEYISKILKVKRVE